MGSHSPAIRGQSSWKPIVEKFQCKIVFDEVSCDGRFQMPGLWETNIALQKISFEETRSGKDC